MRRPGRFSLSERHKDSPHSPPFPSRHSCLSCGKISQPGLVLQTLKNQVATVCILEIASSQTFAASRNLPLPAYTEGEGIRDFVICSSVMQHQVDRRNLRGDTQPLQFILRLGVDQSRIYQIGCIDTVLQMVRF